MVRTGKGKNVFLTALLGPLLLVLGGIRYGGLRSVRASDFESLGLNTLLLLIMSFYMCSLLGCLLGWGVESLMSRLTRSLTARQSQRYATASGEVIETRSPWRDPIQAGFWLAFAVVFWSLSGFALVMVIAGKDLSLYGSLVEHSVFVGLICYVLRRQRSAVSALDLLASDPRPPVVYLRSFRDDGRKIERGLVFELAKLFNLWAALAGRTIEQRIAKALKAVGPFIAVGRPGEVLPETGAARLYVADEDWKKLVADLLSKAGLVVLQAGETLGLQWEIGTIVSVVNPDRLLIFVPATQPSRREVHEKAYQRFRERAQACFPIGLPDTIGDASFLYFDCDPAWAPHLLSSKGFKAEDHLDRPFLKRLA
jgi:hypothetical protein